MCECVVFNLQAQSICPCQCQQVVWIPLRLGASGRSARPLVPSSPRPLDPCLLVPSPPRPLDPHLLVPSFPRPLNPSSPRLLIPSTPRPLDSSSPRPLIPLSPRPLDPSSPVQPPSLHGELLLPDRGFKRAQCGGESRRGGLWVQTPDPGRNLKGFLEHCQGVLEQGTDSPKGPWDQLGTCLQPCAAPPPDPVTPGPEVNRHNPEDNNTWRTAPSSMRTPPQVHPHRCTPTPAGSHCGSGL